jgi:hypothetical protein
MRRQNKQEFIQKLHKGLSLVFLPFRSLWSWLVKTFTFKSTDKILKVIKRSVGLLITLLLGTITFYVVQLGVFLVMIIINAWNGPAVLNIGIPFVIILITSILGSIFIYFSITWIEDFIANYKAGNKLSWYGNLTVHIWNIFEIIAIYVFWVPVRFVFVTFLWEFVAISLIWGAALSFVNIFKTTTGIFGEYFGKGFNDYCPGIEVIDE